MLYRAESIAGAGPVGVEFERSLEVGSCTLKVPGQELNLPSEAQQTDSVGRECNGEGPQSQLLEFFTSVATLSLNLRWG